MITDHKPENQAEKVESGPAEEPRNNPHVLRPKGEPRFMPPDFRISLAARGGTDRWLMNSGQHARKHAAVSRMST